MFWHITPGEFALLCEGAKLREDRAWDKVAWQTAYSLRVWGSEVTPDELLGRARHDAAAEAAAFDAALGVPLTYEQVMAAQREKGLTKS